MIIQQKKAVAKKSTTAFEFQTKKNIAILAINPSKLANIPARIKADAKHNSFGVIRCLFDFISKYPINKKPVNKRKIIENSKGDTSVSCVNSFPLMAFISNIIKNKPNAATSPTPSIRHLGVFSIGCSAIPLAIATNTKVKNIGNNVHPQENGISFGKQNNIRQ